MSDNDNTGFVWKTEDSSYFLRDDTALGIYEFDEQQTYSLFRKWPDYQRVCVITSQDIGYVSEFAGLQVCVDILARTNRVYRPEEIFLDELA